MWISYDLDDQQQLSVSVQQYRTLSELLRFGTGKCTSNQLSEVDLLERQGFHNHICIDSANESELMEKYYAS